MRIRVWIVAPFLAFHPGSAHAHGPTDLPQQGFTLGPSFAYAHSPGAGSGAIYGLDAVYARQIFWVGGGLRAFENLEEQKRRFFPYLEGGIYLLLNIGAGYTLDTNEDAHELSGPHFFVGLPIPLNAYDVSGGHVVCFIEPYYRGTYAGPGTLHEAGVLLKWSRWWDRSDIR